MDVTVVAGNRSWTEFVLSRKSIGRLFFNSEVEKVYVPQFADEPEVLTRWDVFQSFNIDGNWTLSSQLKKEFA